MMFIDLFYLEMWPMFSSEKKKKRKTKPVELLQDFPLKI